MPFVNYPPTSPYFESEQTEFFLTYFNFRKIDPDSSDLSIILDSKYEFRPDLLAFDIYGDSKLWWVFVNRNMDKIKNPIFDFISGIEIFYPKKDRLSFLLKG